MPSRQWGFSTYQDTDQVGHLHTEVLGPQVPTVRTYTCMELGKRQELRMGPRTLTQMNVYPEMVGMGVGTGQE